MPAAGLPVTGAERRQLGEAAEDAALAHLLAQGMALLARNVRYPFGELDLVMRDGATVVFVEVRYRRGSGFGGAAVSVDASKRRKLARAAQAWLKGHREHAQAACRFDVVAATPAAGAPRCEWIAHAVTLDDLR
jgi:putative endonuclease